MDSSPIEKYLIQIEDILEASKSIPFSNKVGIEKEHIYDIIDEIRLNLPNEIKESKKLVENKDKFLREAERKSEDAIENAEHEAMAILQKAEEEALRRTADHEVYKAAIEEAELVLEEAKRDAKNIRLNAMDYADELLSKAEHALKSTLEGVEKQHNYVQEYYNGVINTLYENRQELRGR